MDAAEVQGGSMKGDVEVAMSEQATETRPQGGAGPGPLLEVEVRSIDHQLKEGRVRQFTVMCDESERIGGTDSAPPPLGYFTLAIGF